MITINAGRCPQNHRCPSLRVCPTGALQQEGFNAPFIEQELCIECGKCTYNCPVFSQVSEGAGPRGNGRTDRGNGGATEAAGLGRVLRRFHP